MADFKAASSAISDLKVGSTAVAKVYAGADLVWSPPSSSSDRYTVTGNLATYNSTRFSVSSRTEGGSDTDWWSGYGYGEFRKNSDSQLVWTLLRESSGNPYATAGAFLAAFAQGTITLTVDGTAVSYTSVRLNGSAANNLQIIFEGSGYNTLWSGWSVGDSVSLTLNYSAQTASDWDDYDDGVFYHRRRVAYTDAQIDQLSASSSYSAIGRQDTISSGFRHWNAAVDAYLSSGFAPFIAIWDFSEWKVYKWNGTTGSGNRYFHWYGNGSTNVTNDPGPDRRVIVYLSQDPGTQNGFRDYDGSTDYMVYEDGMVAYEQFGSTASVSSYINPEEVSYSDAYDVPRRFRELTTSTVQLQRFDNTVNGGLLSAYPPYIALWWERTGTSAERDWFIASYSGSNGVYNFVRSKSGATAFHAPTNMSNDFVIVSLTADPGTGISNWTDYGDEKTPWESQETAINFWASGNNWWTLDSNTSWTRGGTLFANAQYIKLTGGYLVMRMTNGSLVSDGQDYIDNYGIPVLWVWINGNKYVFDELNQVTGSGDIILKGPAMSQSDFEENSGTGQNADGWADDVPVKIEFRPQWNTFYPRTALAAGQTSPGAGNVNVQWEDWSSAFNYSSSMVTASSGDHPIGTFNRASLTQMQFQTSGSSYNTYNADNNGVKWFAFKRGTKDWDKGANIEYGSSKTALKAECVYGTLDFNSFATSPIGCLMTSRDPGPVYMWADYDGPHYDWDSYAVQTFVDSSLNTSTSEANRFPLTETMGSGTDFVATIHSAGMIGFSSPQDRCLAGGYQNRANTYSTMPDHHFYHNHSSLIGSGGYSYSGGWHAFGKATDSSYQTGSGALPFNIKEFTTDAVDGGWRGPLGGRNTLVSSSEGGEKAAYWKPPFVNDGLQLAGIFTQMGSTYNIRSDEGDGSNNPKMFMGRKYARLMTDLDDTKNPGYMFLFSNNRLLVQWSGSNNAANKTAFDNGRPSSTCTVRMRQGNATNYQLGLGTEYTYTGTWGTWSSTASLLTLSNGSTGAPTWTSEYNNGTWTPMSLNFMIRIED